MWRGKEHFGLRLHALHTADDEHRRIQRPERTLHLGGKIDVPGRVDEVDLHILPCEADAAGLDRDAAPLLDGQGIRVRGAAVHAALFADGAAEQENLLGERGLARVDMGEDTDTNTFHGNSFLRGVLAARAA